MTCPACGGEGWAPRFERDGYAYVACATCATARLDPLPRAADAEAHDDLGYFEGGTAGGYLDDDAEAPAREANAAAVVARLAALHPARGRLLEVDCASGWLLAAAAADGWNVCGVEVNAEMRRRAQARVPGALLWSSLDEVDAPPSAFDAAASAGCSSAPAGSRRSSGPRPSAWASVRCSSCSPARRAAPAAGSAARSGSTASAGPRSPTPSATSSPRWRSGADPDEGDAGGPAGFARVGELRREDGDG